MMAMITDPQRLVDASPVRYHQGVGWVRGFSSLYRATLRQQDQLGGGGALYSPCDRPGTQSASRGLCTAPITGQGPRVLLRTESEKALLLEIELPYKEVRPPFQQVCASKRPIHLFN